MNRDEWLRTMIVYVPVTLAMVGGFALPRRKRMFAACLLSTLWVMPALLVLARWNAVAGWWTFPVNFFVIPGLPAEVWLGWTVLWGVLPALYLRRVPLVWCVVLLTALDAIVMPLCGPVVVLGRSWLAGEAVAVAVVLLPSLCLGRWTLEDTRLPWRGFLQVVTAGLVFLYLPADVLYSRLPRSRVGWTALQALSGWEMQLAVGALFLLAVPGLSAVQEFVERGRGTPIPYDPPQRLVTTGVYRYCANPMQLSCFVVMLAWALLLRSGLLAAVAAISVVYSAGIARWDEEVDLERRFGEALRMYRSAVPAWRWRWRPFHAGPPARVYLARSCGPCSALRRWMERRTAVGLEIVDAETLPAGSIKRMRYVPAEGPPEEGVRALARTLEHMNAGWAFAGAAIRLPLVSHVAQLAMDASGLGPRTITAEGIATTSCGFDE